MRASAIITCPDCRGTGTGQPELLHMSVRGIACKRCHGNGRIMEWLFCVKCGGYIQTSDPYADLLICGNCQNFVIKEGATDDRQG